MNEELLKVFTRGEVDCALKQMGPFKAPGPDGLPAGFFSAPLGDNGRRGGSDCP